jgi:prepilin-type N-terminal cleavage/methylation domain-containing protein
MRDREAGFTLIELMVTIAVISILAAIALPSFFGEARKAKAASEVEPLFNDLRVRLEQYMQENGRYPPTIGEGTLHPSSAPGPTPVDINPLPPTWATTLKVRISGVDQVRCRYTWATGRPTVDDANIGPVAGDPPPNGFGFTAPSTDWYYLLAKCDMDGGGAGSGSGNNNDKFSWYFTSSVDPTIRKLNEGQ